MRAVLLGLLLLAAPALAYHDPGLPLLDEVRYDGNLWVAYLLAVQAGSSISTSTAHEAADAVISTTASWLLDINGRFPSAVLVTGASGPHTEQHVELGPFGVVHHVDEAGGRDWVRYHGRVEFYTAYAYWLVRAVASDGAPSGSFELHATPEVQLLGKTMGTDAFIFRDDEFHGTVNVIVNDYIPYSDTDLERGAKVAADVALTRPLDHRFFGIFQGDGEVDRLSYESPHGQGEGRSLYSFVNAGPGAYTFRADQQASVSYSHNRLWLFGADVELP